MAKSMYLCVFPDVTYSDSRNRVVVNNVYGVLTIFLDRMEGIIYPLLKLIQN